MSNTINVFVYGTLRRGFGNHEYLLSHAPLVEEIDLRGYEMWAGQGGGIPVIRSSSDASSLVHGEVYEVDERTLQGLDRLEGHPDWYVRTEIQPGLWTYLAGEDWNMTIESGRMVRVMDGDFRRYVDESRRVYRSGT